MATRATTAASTLAAALAALASLAPSVLPCKTAPRGIERRIAIPAPPPPATTEADAAPTAATIEQAVTLAYEANPRLLAEQYSVRGADARYTQARAAYGPTLSLRGSYGYAYDQFDTALGGRATNEGFSATATAVLSHPLFTSGRLKAGVRTAEADIAAGRENLRLIESQVLYGVYSAYIGVQRDRDLVRIADENYDLLARQLAQSQMRLEVREITRADMDQIRTRLAVGIATAETVRAALSNSRASFLRFVGALPAETLAPLPAAPAALPATLEDAYVAGEAESPLLLAAHARERRSRAQVNQAESALGPTVSAQASATYGALEPYSNDLNQRNVRAGVVAEWPVFTSGLRLARIREAQALNQADWRLVDDALREMRATISQNWDRMVAGQRAVVQYRIAVDAAKSAYDGAVEQERAGARTTFEVLDLLRDLLDVRSAMVRAEADAELAGYSLLAAMGQLQAPVQVDGLPAYDPAAKLHRTRNYGTLPPVTTVTETLDGITSGKVRNKDYRDPAAKVRAPGLPANDAATSAAPVTKPAPAIR